MKILRIKLPGHSHTSAKRPGKLTNLAQRLVKVHNISENATLADVHEKSKPWLARLASCTSAPFEAEVNIAPMA
jgi:hypothetical protein